MAGRDRAFTFLEIIIVVSLLLILFAMGVPFFLHHRAERDLEGAQRQLAASLTQARQTSLVALISPTPSSTPAPGATPRVGCVLVFTPGPPARLQVWQPELDIVSGNYSPAFGDIIVPPSTPSVKWNRTLDYQAPVQVALATPGAATQFMFDCGGHFYDSGGVSFTTPQVFTLSSSNTSTTLTFTLYSSTGGVTVP